jgi:D-alanine-D-alanine ligase
MSVATVPKLRVGVLRGGVSPEYDVSLKTGGAVLRHLPAEKYTPVDLLVTKDGQWHVNGRHADLPRVSKNVDVVWNALHGEYGEDGKVSALLDHFSIPYTGSKAIPSALGMNKVLAKELFVRAGIKTPASRVIKYKNLVAGGGKEKEMAAREDAYEVFHSIAPPWIIKPISGGSSVGTYIVKTYPDLIQTFIKLAEAGNDALLEEFIRGKEATCGVIDHFRGRETYSLLPIEIRPAKEHYFFNYDAKYGGETEEIVPGNFSRNESIEIQRLAVAAHKALGLRHYSRSDFIVTPRAIYILEVNTLPGLTEHSLLPKSLHAVGASFPEFLDHIITLARRTTRGT